MEKLIGSKQSYSYKCLPSDSTYRKDILYKSIDDIENGQVFKEEYENL